MSGDRLEGVGRDEATVGSKPTMNKSFFFFFFFLSLNPHKKPSPSFFIYPTKIIPFKTLGNSKNKSFLSGGQILKVLPDQMPRLFRNGPLYRTLVIYLNKRPHHLTRAHSE